eukprot:PITA_23785
MGFIYEAMDQAKEQIKRAYKDRVAKYGPIWAIIDERWNNQLHRPIHVTTFNNASGTFGKILAKIAREANEPVLLGVSAIGLSLRIHTKKRNRLDQKRLNDPVYVQYNLRLRRNQSLDKIPDSDPIVLEDIDPTSDWVVESHPTEFDPYEDLDLDLDIEGSVEHDVQLNADPDPPVLPASVSQPARTPVAGASFTQPRQKRSHISSLSQLASVAVAQPASGTTSTVAVGDDDDDEEPWGPLFDSDDDLEID